VDELDPADVLRMLRMPRTIWAANGTPFRLRVVDDPEATAERVFSDPAAFVHFELIGPGEAGAVFIFDYLFELIQDEYPDPSWPILACNALLGYEALSEALA
jgi:hypothetical protein